MYCISRLLTVCQSKCSSLATSFSVDARHRRPTKKAKRLVYSDCRRSKSASPASPDRNSGTPLAATPPRDTLAYPRMRDLARAVSCGRRMSCALDRKRRKLFFLHSLQDHDPSLGISKHTPHPSARPESWKAIGILESLLFPWHSSIMPFSRGLNCGRTLGRGRREACSGLKIRIFHPHDSTKTAIIVGLIAPRAASAPAAIRKTTEGMGRPTCWARTARKSPL